jgi:hypothetical protein
LCVWGISGVCPAFSHRLLPPYNQARALYTTALLVLPRSVPQANTAMAAAAAAVVDLCGELQALRRHLQHEQWRVELEQVLQRQLPQLKVWADLQVRATSGRVQPQSDKLRV